MRDLTPLPWNLGAKWSGTLTRRRWSGIPRPPAITSPRSARSCEFSATSSTDVTLQWPPMKKVLIVLATLLFVTATVSVGHAQTAAQAQVDRWWPVAEQMVEKELFAQALSAMSNIVGLIEDGESIELPSDFWFVLAQALHGEGLHRQAVGSAARHIAEQGPGADHYLDAQTLTYAADKADLRQRYSDRRVLGLNVTPGNPNMVPPVLKRSGPKPRYTPQARWAGVEGAVGVSFILGEDGRVIEVNILRDIGFGMGDAVAKYVKRRRYEPATLNGEPVAAYAQFHASFRLPNRNAPGAIPELRPCESGRDASGRCRDQR